jgi:hypothetical protein
MKLCCSGGELLLAAVLGAEEGVRILTITLSFNKIVEFWDISKIGPYQNAKTSLKQYRVEVPITDHLRDYAPNLEKYKAVHIFLVGKMRL